MNRCGNPYLSKGITKEFEVADTEGSTATGSPSKKSETYYVCFCVFPHTKTIEIEEK
jgi:hypothetical protein